MDSRNPEKQNEPEEPRFLSFKHLPEGTVRDGQPVLNRYSSTLTNAHDFPGAQVNYLAHTLSPLIHVLSLR